jgi:N-acetylneuraminic acid mutarotase
MKKLVMIPFFILIIIGCSKYWSPTSADHIIKTDPWKEIAKMPTARSVFTASLVNNKIYCIGGAAYNQVTDTWDIRNNVEAYDPMSDSWTILSPMLHSRSDHEAAVVDGKIYVIGGWSNTNSSDVLVFNPANQSWTTMPGSATWRMGCAVSVFNNKIYIFGGTTDNATKISNLVEEFDPATGIFSQKTAMPTGREYCSATTMNDKIFVIGGVYSRGNSADISKVEVYDPKKDSWLIYKNVNLGLADFGTADPEGAVNLGNKIHVLGEFCHFEYDPNTQKTIQKSVKNIYTAQCGYEVFNSKIYNFGGTRWYYYNATHKNMTLANCYVYDPNEDEWK